MSIRTLNIIIPYLVILCVWAGFARSADVKQTSAPAALNTTVTIAQESNPVLRLEDLIQLCLENSPSIEVVRQRLAGSRGQLTQAWADYLPTLVVSGRYSYIEKEDTSSSDDPEIEDREIEEGEELERRVGLGADEGDVLHGAVEVTQLLYDFGQTTALIESGELNVNSVDAELQRRVQDIVFDVKDAYYNVLEKRRLVDVAFESVESFTNHLDRTQLYLKAGVRTKIDVINAEVELSNADMSFLRAEYDLKIARTELEQALGIKPFGGEYKLYADEIHLDSLQETLPPLTGDIKGLVQEALTRRPDVIQLQKLNKATESRLHSISGEYWPRITAEAGYNDYDTDLSDYEDSWEVGIAARWELFSGLRTEGKYVEARAELLENRAKLKSLKLAVVQEVTENYLRADENRKSVDIALKTLELARENVVLAEKRYKTGAFDVLEFNDAQLRLTTAKGDLVVAYYNYLSAFAQIEHAMGGFSFQNKENPQ